MTKRKLLIQSVDSMRPIKPRLPFASTLAKALSIGAQKRGIFAYVPLRLIACVVSGAIIAGLTPNEFWLDKNQGASLAVYGGILAFNGLLLAIGWGAFSKIYEIVGAADFAAFLRRSSLLDIHIFFVDLVHGALIAAATVSFFGLVLLPINLPVLLDAVLFAFIIGLSLNSLLEAMRASAMMHDLLWDKSISDAEMEQRRPLRSVANGE